MRPRTSSRWAIRPRSASTACACSSCHAASSGSATTPSTSASRLRISSPASSASSATPRTPPSTNQLRVLHEDVADAARRGVARVDRILERLVDVLPPDHDHGVDAVVLEEAHPGGTRDPVAFILELLDRDH